MFHLLITFEKSRRGYVKAVVFGVRNVNLHREMCFISMILEILLPKYAL